MEEQWGKIGGIGRGCCLTLPVCWAGVPGQCDFVYKDRFTKR